MLLRICAELTVPLRQQNQLLLAAGHAPAHPEHDLAAPTMREVQQAITAILAGHRPHPALVIDRGWDVVDANEPAWAWLDGVAPRLLEPPANVLRLGLHPDGLAPRIRNLPAWRAHLLNRLRHEYDATGDERLARLLDEFGDDGGPPGPTGPPALVAPLELRVDGVDLSFISTTTVFGTPLEVTVSELAIEAFHPADEATRAFLAG